MSEILTDEEIMEDARLRFGTQVGPASGAARAGFLVGYKAALAAAAEREKVLVEALEEIDSFAWTAVDADCDEARVELNRRIEVCRAALAMVKECP